VTRAACLARAGARDGLPPQRWFVDAESGLVVRLPRTERSDELSRFNMRSNWREAKRAERWAARTVSLAPDADGGDALLRIPDDSPGADVAGAYEEKETRAALRAALDALDPRDRDLIVSIYWRGKTERQLAPELGLKQPKSVNNRKHRVLGILRSHEAIRGMLP
jgi:RNA polymerase sigma factor (sigma-70 family)